jgi:hypothetical protein
MANENNIGDYGSSEQREHLKSKFNALAERFFVEVRG